MAARRSSPSFAISPNTSRLGESSFPTPAQGWPCFHCGEVFYHAGPARRHFGDTPADIPRCKQMAKQIMELKAALEVKNGS